MFRALVVIVLGLLAAGCGGYPTYYMLAADGPAPSGGGRAIGVGPVSLASYIDRPHLVVQTEKDGAMTLEVAGDHRWAGDLESSVSRVMAANLGRRLKTGNVLIYPWQRDEEISRQVVIDIRQFHGGADGHAVLEASFRVYALPGKTLVASRTFSERERLEKDGYPAMVAAESRLMSRLADEIAKAMR